jgi:hypothetical protein
VAETRQSWEQQEGEPAAAYAHFLLYRSLGLARSLNRAYRASLSDEVEGNRRQEKAAPGSWTRESRAWRWRERAEAWDVHVLTTVSTHAVAGAMALLDRTAVRAVRWVDRSGGCSDPGWEWLLETIRALGGEITQAAADALRAGAAVAPGGGPAQGPERLGGRPGGVREERPADQDADAGPGDDPAAPGGPAP